MNTIAAITHYLERGFAITHIPPRQKFPTHDGWNQPGGYFTESSDALAYWKAHPRDNLGVVLEPSRLCSLDADHLEYTRRVLAELGTDLDLLIKSYPTIEGRPDRCRITFQAPADVTLSRKTLVWPGKNGDKETTVFELRAGPIQDVWPPSIHPDTGQPYRWITPLPEGDLPELPAALLELWQHWDSYKDNLTEICPWAKPKERPTPKRTTEGVSVIAAFNQAHDVESLLESHGYQRKGKRWLAPSSSTKLPGVSVKDGRVYSHHGSDLLADGYAHDAFDAYRLLEHNGDFKGAVKAAAKLLGMDYPAKGNTRRDAPQRDVPPLEAYVNDPKANRATQSDDPHREDIIARALSGIVTADAFAKLEFAPIRWAVEGILPAGLTLFAGPPKIGKTRLAFNIALAVACGGMALGTIPVEQGEVLYIVRDDPKRRLHDMLLATCEQMGIAPPANLHLVFDWPLPGQGCEECLDRCDPPVAVRDVGQFS